jgi:hypothetical protein
MMPAARLTGELLARKGRATPVAGFCPTTDYGAPQGVAGLGSWRMRPSPSGTASPRQVPPTAPADARVRVSLRLDADAHARLRILAARHGRRLQAVLGDAVNRLLESSGLDCPCLRDLEGECCGERGTPGATTPAAAPCA